MKYQELRKLIKEELEMDELFPKQKAFHQLKPYHVVKVTGFKPGALDKIEQEIENHLNNLNIKEPNRSYRRENLYNVPESKEEIERDLIGKTKIVKTHLPQKVDQGALKYYGYMDSIPVNYSDLEYEVYQVQPNPQITKIK